MKRKSLSVFWKLAKKFFFFFATIPFFSKVLYHLLNLIFSSIFKNKCTRTTDKSPDTACVYSLRWLVIFSNKTWCFQTTNRTTPYHCINQLSGKGADLRRVASLVHRLHRVTSSSARIPLNYCNLLICLFMGVQWVSNSFTDGYSKLN